ncbi:MAG: FHA domain-containing protein [Deltaproteobacteria bacterium]|nr:MAG: FHA domain-containing protein [Deltaproteobacteria bacterium]
MASSRRPTALGHVPAPGGASPGGAPAGGGVDDDEKTTVDGGPPSPPRRATPDRWEERTVQEGGGALLRRAAADIADADSVAGTIERGLDAETIEETTTGSPPPNRLAIGSSDLSASAADAGLSTIDEPTVDQRAQRERARQQARAAAADEEDNKPTRIALHARLIVIGGNDRGREFAIDSARTTVGRGVDNDIVLTDIAVSRRHMSIEFDGAGFVVRDHKSGNGTLVNNERREVARLSSGDQIEIGNTLLRFECPQADGGVAAEAAEFDEDAKTIEAGAPAAAGGKLPLPSGARVRAALPTQAPAFAPARASVPLPASRPVRRRESAHGALSGLPEPAGALPTMPVPRIPDAPQLTPEEERRRRLWIGAGVAGALVALTAIGIALSGDAPARKAGVSAAGEMLGIGAAITAARSVAAPTAAAPDAGAPRATPAVTPLVLADAGTPLPVVAVPAPDAAPAVAAPDAAVKRAIATPPRAIEPPARKRTERVPPRRNGKKRAPPKRRVGKRSSPPRRAVERAPSPERAVASARARALAQYKGKKFAAAAASLREVAGRAGGDRAEIERLADDYAAVGTQLALAERSKASNPPAAMAAYRKALTIDRRSGGGAHARYIRLQLGEVAPRAAASFMAQKKYEAAKRACDAAVNYGAGADPMVARVRRGLERVAAGLYQEGVRLRKANPAKASGYLKRVLRIVPPDSPWYAKAYAALNATKPPRDDDE